MNPLCISQGGGSVAIEAVIASLKRTTTVDTVRGWLERCVAGLLPSSRAAPPPQPHACASAAPRLVSRRRALCGLAAASVSPTLPAHALFESPEQNALLSLATTKQKLKGLVAEVAEVKRKRQRMVGDEEDDAYVFRFMRSVLDPAAKEMEKAAPIMKSARTQELTADFAASVANLQSACRKKDAGDELQALQAADQALSEFLELAAAQKYDVKSRDDINGYDGMTGLLYNKFIFAK